MERIYLAYILEMFARRLSESDVDTKRELIRMDAGMMFKAYLKPNFEDAEVTTPEPVWELTIDMARLTEEYEYLREEICRLFNLVEDVEVPDDQDDIVICKGEFESMKNMWEALLVL